jgi:hypothetical protein
MPIPWASLLVFAPQVLEVSRELLKRARKQPDTQLVPHGDADVAQRLVALEENERRQAELIERMAAQQAELARAVVALHRRQYWLIAAIVVLAAVLAWRAF